MPNTNYRVPTQERDWLYPGEAARLLGVSRDTLIAWVKKGKLGATKTLNGHSRYLKEEVESLIDRQLMEGE